MPPLFQRLAALSSVVLSNVDPLVRHHKAPNDTAVVWSSVAKPWLDVADKSAEGGGMESEVPGMADAIEERRVARQLSPGDFARAADLTPQGLVPVRRGQRREYQAKVRHGVARALAWPLDWYDRLLAGEDWHAFPDVEHGDPRTTDARLSAVEAEVAEIREVLGRVEQAIEGRAP
jgi:hypothetical protein